MHLLRHYVVIYCQHLSIEKIKGKEIKNLDTNTVLAVLVGVNGILIALWSTVIKRRVNSSTSHILRGDIDAIEKHAVNHVVNWLKNYAIAIIDSHRTNREGIVKFIEDAGADGLQLRLLCGRITSHGKHFMVWVLVFISGIIIMLSLYCCSLFGCGDAIKKGLGLACAIIFSVSFIYGFVYLISDLVRREASVENIVSRAHARQTDSGDKQQ